MGRRVALRFLAGAAVVVVLALVVPTPEVGAAVIDAPSLHALGFGSGDDHLEARAVVVLVVGSLGLLCSLLRQAGRWLGFLVTAILLAGFQFHLVELVATAGHSFARATGTADGARRSWIDDQLGRNERVTLLWVAPSANCGSARRDILVGRSSAQSSVFFNSGFIKALHTGASPDVALPGTVVRLKADGRLAGPEGPIAGGYLVAQSVFRFEGTRLARGPLGTLTLWKASSPLRVLDVGVGPSALSDRVCTKR